MIVHVLFMLLANYWVFFKGMAADVGTLQRMPKAIGNLSTFNELAFTARKFDSSEAKNIGFVSQVYDTKERYFLNTYIFYNFLFNEKIILSV